MKRFVVLFVALATMFVQGAYAQQASQQTEAQREEAKARREQLMQTRLELLKEELNLTDEQFVKFDPVYRKFRQEIQRVTASNREARMKKEEITNENALKVVSARLANDILTSSVKQRYVLIFAEVIEPLQVLKLYRVEGRISREANKIMKSRQAAAASAAK